MTTPLQHTRLQDPIVALPSTQTPGVDQAFPTLTDAQIARVGAHGNLRRIERGETLVRAGVRNASFFVTISGHLEVVQLSNDVERVIAVHRPGQISGEINLLSGRRALFSMRAAEAGEVIEVSHDQLMAIVQTDADLSEILMRAFLLRRARILAGGVGDVVLIGSSNSQETLRIKEFLSRNTHPYSYIDLERDEGVQEILDHFKVAVTDVPVMICRGEVVLRNPSNADIAECLGFNEVIDQVQMHDAVIVGAGPSGWRRQFTRRPKASTFWCWSRTLREDRPVPARESRITSAFRRAFRGRS